MPIVLLCPGCEARIKVADTAAGKTAKCPKCATAFIIPALEPAPIPTGNPGFEVIDDDEPIVAPPLAKPKTKSSTVLLDDEDDDPRPVKKKRARDYDDDDDDYEDERPVKKRKKAAVSKKALPIIPIAIAAGILLLVGAGIGGYYLFKGGVAGLGGNWTKFDAPDGSFSASFPGGAPIAGGPSSTLSKNPAAANNPQAQQMADQAKAAMEMFGMKMEAWTRTESERQYIIGYLSFPKAMAGMMNAENTFKNNAGRGNGFGGAGMGTGSSVISEEKVTISGQAGNQALIKKSETEFALVRVFVIKNRLFMLIVQGDKNLTKDDAKAKAFFDKFELKNVPDPPPDSGKNPLEEMMKGQLQQGMPKLGAQPGRPTPRK